MTGAIHPGDMCAVMGPSGAGKTTLLDIVSRRKTEGKVLGQARFDGAVPSTSLVKKDTAYIQQQDCFFGGATVRETIMFAAMAKLPRLSRRDGVSGTLVCCSDSEDTQEKRARVSRVINQLNLDRCAETYMGNRLIRGVSGGEMKRAAVACALLCSPRCMFLDEPTSGLDSAMAFEVIANLRHLRDQTKCTFVVSIHQPSPTVFEAFDRLILLNYGKVAYFGVGGPDAPLAFFAKQGFPYQPGYNVAEYLIDTLNSHSTACGGEHDFERFYADSNLRRENEADVADDARAFPDARSAPNGFGMSNPSKYANGPLRELFVLLRYKGLSRVKHPIFVSTRILLYVLLAGLLSSFFYGQDRRLVGIFNSVGILFIAVILPCFMAQVFVEEMKFDREVYTREFNDAYYRAGTYVAHRVLVEMPAVVAAAAAFCGVLYWSVGFDDDVKTFGFFFTACVVNFSTAMLIGFSIAAAIRGEVGPAVVLPVFTTLNMLVGGFFIRRVSIHALWIWLYWISFIQWTWSALMTNEFQGREFYDHCGGDVANGGAAGINDLVGELPLTPDQTRGLELYASSRADRPCEPVLGDTVLASFDLDKRDKWLSLLYAACSTPAFLLTFYLGVRFVKHERR